MKTFVTFGQDHAHSINGKTFDKDCVAVVEGGRDRVFELFGPKFCWEYPEDHWDDSKMVYYPRGYIEVDDDLDYAHDSGLDDASEETINAIFHEEVSTQ